MSVIDEIAAERRRQVEVEGWSERHDDEHADGQMADAAACYAASHVVVVDDIHIHSGKLQWPWDSGWWKPKDRRRDLVRAGALIVAEIERLDRAAETRG